MHPDTLNHHAALFSGDREIRELLAREITAARPEAEDKVRHGHPVWFLDGNPVVGYSKRKHGVSLLSRSGRSSDEEGRRERLE